MKLREYVAQHNEAVRIANEKRSKLKNAIWREVEVAFKKFDQVSPYRFGVWIWDHELIPSSGNELSCIRIDVTGLYWKRPDHAKVLDSQNPALVKRKDYSRIRNAMEKFLRQKLQLGKLVEVTVCLTDKILE
ncbi:MAG: hypothetical protein Q7S09_00530 [bacterium]|nr:hypothetical protein [bacterium]